jgi:hypothetical protein
MPVSGIPLYIPECNEVDLLETCPQSNLGQTHPCFEHVISGNRPTEGTLDDDDRCNDKQIRYYRNKAYIAPYPKMNYFL